MTAKEIAAHHLVWTTSLLTETIVLIIIISVMMFAQGIARLIELVAGININLTRMTQQILKTYNLTYPQFGALMALSGHGECSQKELAELLDTDTTTSMVLCQGLESKGLLTRLRDERDRRAYRLALTEAGRELVKEAYPAVEAVYAPLADLVSAEEVAAVLPTLERLWQEVKQRAKGGGD